LEANNLVISKPVATALRAVGLDRLKRTARRDELPAPDSQVTRVLMPWLQQRITNFEIVVSDGFGENFAGMKE
jgi:hypothetical protein